MEQHAIPRQITNFEFKLIGFLTLKQFIYLLVFLLSAYALYSLFPIPILNILFAVILAGIGIVFALVPIYDRPADVWIKNIYKKLISPTQFLYKKNNPPIYFFNNLYFLNDPHRVIAHIESQEKLAAYLARAQVPAQPVDNRKTAIKQQLAITGNPNPKSQNQNNQNNKSADNLPAESADRQPTTNIKKPFFTGVVKNHRLIPLPGILVYVKDATDKTLRLLKSNPHGVFATFNILPPGEYVFEIKDPKGGYFFDTIKINLDTINPKPLEFFSKELI